MAQIENSKKQAARLGTVAGLLLAVLNAWFFIAYILNMPALKAPWPGIVSYASAFQPQPMLAWIIPCLFIGPAVPIMMSCLYFGVGEEKRLWGTLAVVFSVPTAAILSLNYYIQMTVVRYNLVVGQTDGLSLLLYTNTYPFTIPGAMEAVGYGFMCLSFLFASQVFGQGKLQKWVRWMFIGIAITGSVVFIDPLIRIPMPILLVDGLLGGIFLTLGPILTAILFLKSSKKSIVL